MASQTYNRPPTMNNNTYHSCTVTVSNNASGYITVNVTLSNTSSSRSWNNDASNNFYIIIAGETFYRTVKEVAAKSSVSFSAGKYVSVAANGTGSANIQVGGQMGGGSSFYIATPLNTTYSFSDGNKASYTVSFVNGLGSTLNTQTVTYGGSATPPSNPTRTGHTFAGWSGTYTNVTSNRTITATWKANTYTVSYNANGGSGAPSSHSYTYGSSTPFYLNSTKPTRTGYDFLGWSLSSSATSASYSAGQAWSTSNGANYTLYAVWKLKTYTVSYNANGGSGAPASQTKTHGAALTLDSTIPTRADSINSNGDTVTYTFKGWATSSAGSIDYLAGSSYTNNATVTLYAVWDVQIIEADIKYVYYNVIYNSNGGNSIDSQIKEKGEILVLRDDIPVRNGYTFEGWGLTIDDTTVDYEAGDTYSVDADIILYAIWTPWEHNVVFNINGGTGEIPEGFIKISGIESFISNIVPTKEGCTFNYWSTLPEGYGGKKYKAGDGYNYAQDGGIITLYARWREHKVQLGVNKTVIATEFIEYGGLEPQLAFGLQGEVYTKGEIIEGSTMINATASGVFYCSEFIER